MDRRQFLKLFGGATGSIVATATMAEAGMLAEVMDWLKRMPVWSFPKPEPELGLTYADINAVTIKYITKEFIDNFYTGLPSFADTYSSSGSYAGLSRRKINIPIKTPFVYTGVQRES